MARVDYYFAIDFWIIIRPFTTTPVYTLSYHLARVASIDLQLRSSQPLLI